VQFVAKISLYLAIPTIRIATNFTNYHEQQSVKIRVIRGKRTNHTLRHQPPDSHEFHELPRTTISENSCNSWQRNQFAPCDTNYQDSHEFHELPRTTIGENSCNSWQKEIRAIRGRVTDMTNIVVIGMGYVGIPCAALLADVGWRWAFPSPVCSGVSSVRDGRSSTRAGRTGG
jgi:hypothetical protein